MAVSVEAPWVDIAIDSDFAYVVLGSSYEVSINNSDVNWSSSDESIAVVTDGVVSTVSTGEVVITASKYQNSDSITLYVTDLISEPTLNNSKDYLSCGYYTDEENALLDELLSYYITEAGYSTRAGVVAAARFLTLQFKYRIAYFYENGRMSYRAGLKYADGEGRYYHVGLYLSESKYSSIAYSLYGPAMWGCSLYSYPIGAYSANGLDCSGFVSWALLNAGFDVGDIGSGYTSINDLADLGELLKINETNLLNGDYKVGDLFSRDGHIGMLIGLDDEYFYIAEALDYDLHVLVMTKDEVLTSDWSYIILMDSVYLADGDLTDMW